MLPSLKDGVSKYSKTYSLVKEEEEKEQTLSAELWSQNWMKYQVL